jgi:SAM-dependent methyltransferase
MDDEQQAVAYARGDFAEPNSRFVRYFSEVAGPDFEGCILDLGCGPGDIALRLAHAHPHATVLAVDGSPAMVRLAREAVAATPDVAGRVQVFEARLPHAALPRETYDAIVSNSLLHHLPDPAVLWSMISRRAAPGAPVVIMDLFRPPNAEAAMAIVDAYARDEALVLKRDFLASLHAAFEPDEVRAQLTAAGLEELEPQVVSDRHLLVAGRRRQPPGGRSRLPSPPGRQRAD